MNRHPQYRRRRLLRCLNDNIGGDIFDVGGLLLDGLAIWSKGSVKLSDPELAHENIRGERGRSPILTCLTRQKLEIMIGLGLGDALRFRGTTVPIRHRDGKARAPYEGGSAAVGDTEPAKIVDDPCSLRSMRDGRDPPANSNRGDRCADGGCALVAELSADKTKRAFGERSRNFARTGGRVIHETIDHKVAVRTDVEGGFVNEQKLNRPLVSRLNAFLMHDPRANS